MFRVVEILSTETAIKLAQTQMSEKAAKTKVTKLTNDARAQIGVHKNNKPIAE